jgi:hypothetical protein
MKSGDAKSHRKNAEDKPDSDKRHVREREVA